MGDRDYHHLPEPPAEEVSETERGVTGTAEVLQAVFGRDVNDSREEQLVKDDRRDVTKVIDLLDQAMATTDAERRGTYFLAAKRLLRDMDARTGRRDPSVRALSDGDKQAIVGDLQRRGLAPEPEGLTLQAVGDTYVLRYVVQLKREDFETMKLATRRSTAALWRDQFEAAMGRLWNLT